MGLAQARPNKMGVVSAKVGVMGKIFSLLPQPDGTTINCGNNAETSSDVRVTVKGNCIFAK